MDSTQSGCLFVCLAKLELLMCSGPLTWAVINQTPVSSLPANPFPFTQRSFLCKSHTISTCQQLYRKNSQKVWVKISQKKVKVEGNTCQFRRSFFCSAVWSCLRWQSLILRLFHRRVRLTLFDRPTWRLQICSSSTSMWERESFLS